MNRKREIVSLLVCACSLVAGGQQAPIQVRFNSPGTLRGSQPWYSSKPVVYQGKVPIVLRPASQVETDYKMKFAPPSLPPRPTWVWPPCRPLYNGCQPGN